MIALEADLLAETRGLTLRITGHANVLTCSLAGEPIRVLQTMRNSGQLLAACRRVIPFLVRSGTRVDVVVGTRRMARIGSGVRQNALARLLRLPDAHLGG
jgi:hypothetical protein